MSMNLFNDPSTPTPRSPDSRPKQRIVRRLLFFVPGILMVVALMPVVPATATVTTSAYTPVTPLRMMDTRSSTKLGPGGTRDLLVAGVSPVPGGATAVVLNVTVTNTTAPSFLTVYPTGATRPLASNLNWTAGKTIPNLVEVPIGSGGKVTFYNAAGSTDVIADLEGYFAAPSGTTGEQVALTPARITDTRNGSGKPNSGSHLGAGATLNIQVSGQGGVPALPGVLGAILNVTVTNTTAPSFLTVWPQGATRPLASNLNWTKGLTIPNRVFVPINQINGKISVYNSAGSTDVIVDVSGYFTDASASGALFTPQNPTRLADTRVTHTTLHAGTTMTLQVGGVAGVPSDASAVILNVTATNTTAASFLTVYPSTASRPLASDLNWTAGVTIPNLTVATLGSTGAINIYNPSGSVDVVVDLFGYFRVPSAPPAPPSLVSAALNLGTKTITVTWDQVVDCPVGSAGDFTFADAYTGPGKASSTTSALTASAVANNGPTGATTCTVTFAGESGNFGTNDYGTLTYTKDPSPTIDNSVNNANGFASTGSKTAADTSTPNLSVVGAMVGSNIFEVTYDEPISCSSVATSDYTITLNAGADAVTAFDCNGASGASGGSSSKVNVTVSTAPTSTSDAWTLSSHTVSDQFGQVEPGTQSKSGFASPAIHLTGLTSTYTGLGGGTGTI